MVYVISEMMAKKPTPKNIIQATDYLEGRFDMGSDIDDALLFKVEEKLKGKLPFLRKTKKNPVKPRKGESERKFVSRCMSEEKVKFPKVKQRIAVCLSKSQSRRNPFNDRNLDA